MKRISKRILSLGLVLAMMLGMSVTASAAGGSVTLEVGESQTLSATFYTTGEYRWTSDNPSVSVSGSEDTAVITGVSAGSAMIYAEITYYEMTEDEEGNDLPIPITEQEAWSVTVKEKPTEEKPVEVEIDISQSSMWLDVGESYPLSVSVVSGNESDVTNFSWHSGNDSVISLSGSGKTATVNALSAGMASVSVTATYGAGMTKTVQCFVTVNAVSAPVKVSGGSRLNMKAGSSENVTASVSGGSGSYEYAWNHQGAVTLKEEMRTNAALYAMEEGSGTVSLTVYDAENRTNCDTTTWEVTVESSATPLSVTVSPSSLNLSAGGSGMLTANASGGSGNNSNYQYNWHSTSNKVSVSGSGATATVRAVSAGTATVTVDVLDKATGLVKSVDAVVVVAGGSGSYNASGSATVGANYPLSSVASNIASEFQRQFGKAASSSAVVQITSPSGPTGMLRAQSGSQLRSNESISFGSFQGVYFLATSAGTFTTAYSFTDGGNKLTGTLSITSSGGSTVTGMSISATSLDMATYSSRYLSLNVTPVNAPYSVRWTSSNSSIAYVSGSGTSVTVETGGYAGSAVITATVTGTNGGSFSRSCTVHVSSSKVYNNTMTVTLGSDYYGSSASDNLAKQFRSVYGYNLDYNRATIRFSSTGNSRYGVMHQGNGSSIRANTSYTFNECVDMYFEPLDTGTFSLPYVLDYRGDSLSGTLDIYIRGASVSATISQTSMTLATYSNQSLNVNVTPSNVYYTVSWRSSNTAVATVSGNGVSATVKSAGTIGTATITAVVTDRNGVEVRRNCTVTVSNKSNTYNPSVSTTIGVPYRGTGTYDALKAQFKSVYGVNLPDSATIRFSAISGSNVAVVRLANGTPVKTNTNYTMAEYAAMYTDPIAAGTNSATYTLTYGGNTLTGTTSIIINGGSVNASISLEGTQSYYFYNAASGGATGSSMLGSTITNAFGGNWSYLRFGTSTSSVGTLYLDANRNAVGSRDVDQSALGNLYFVPNYGGDYSIPFTVHNTIGSTVGSGTLYIRVNASNGTNTSSSFGDVKDNDWFAVGVKWAVGRGITNGMGKKNGVEQFEPETTCNTAQILTFLWRSQGSPLPTISNPFNDVKSSDYFYNAALWAYEKGLVIGPAFGEKTPCTRAAVVTYMWKLAGKPGAEASSFSDVTSGSETASAVDWALSRNITSGIGNDSSGRPMFGPGMTCNRGQIVTFLCRAYA